MTNVNRWYKHIKSYEAEFASLSGSSSAGEAFLGGAAAAAPAEDDDDEVDLFGSDDEEDAEAERIKAERVAAYNAKKAAKPKPVAKVRCSPSISSYMHVSLPLSSKSCKYIASVEYHVDSIIQSVVTFEVKPWDDETDMAELEKSVRSIEMEGLVWGSSKLVAIGYGIKKLQITIVVGKSL